eukprot:10303589-Alexandrium_andersonii.AAC.1
MPISQSASQDLRMNEPAPRSRFVQPPSCWRCARCLAFLRLDRPLLSLDWPGLGMTGPAGV